MAFVHPSRMALIPKDSRPLPPSASSPHPRPSSTNRGRDRSLDRHPRRSRDEEHNGERERRRERGRSSDRDVHRDQDRHQSRHRSNGDRYNDRRDENRDSDPRGPRAHPDDRSSVRSPPPPLKPTLGRASPTYDDYSRRPPPPRDDRPGRPDSPPENGPPLRQQENMYRRDGRLDGGDDYFERYVALCMRMSEALMVFSKGADNSVLIVLSVSGPRPLVLPQGVCAYSLFFSSSTLYPICTL